MAFEFEQRKPGPELDRWVESVWFARGQIAYRHEWIAPTGSTVAVLNLGDPIVHASTGIRASRLRATTGWLSGPHDRPSFNEPLGRTCAYGVVTTPIGAATTFGVDPRALRGRVVRLGTWRRGPRLRTALAKAEASQGLEHLLAELHAGLCEVDPIVRTTGTPT